MKAKLITLLLMGLVATSFTSCDKDLEYKDAVEIVDKTNMMKEVIEKSKFHRATKCHIQIGSNIKETYEYRDMSFEPNNTVRFGIRYLYISDLTQVIFEDKYNSPNVTPTFIFK
ncbi:MAG: hypothetical protein ACRDCN_12640 [Tannerellaceae bacterium]